MIAPYNAKRVLILLNRFGTRNAFSSLKASVGMEGVGKKEVNAEEESPEIYNRRKGSDELPGKGAGMPNFGSLYPELSKEKVFARPPGKDPHLKFGDVIFLKYDGQSMVPGPEGDPTAIRWVGYLGGEGIASDLLSCNHKRMASEMSVVRFLFRIEPSSASAMRETEIMQNMDQAAFSEPDLSEELPALPMSGAPVYYGQPIILRHLLSGSFITFKPSELAKQIGSVKSCLSSTRKDGSEILRFMPASRVKKIGDYVAYADGAFLASSKQEDLFLHVADILGTRELGLEVNGSETAAEWQPRYFGQAPLHGSGHLRPGQVVRIFSLHSLVYLSAGSIDISNITSTQKLSTRGGIASQIMKPTELEFDWVEHFSEMKCNLKVIKENSLDLGSLWEIVRIKAFDPKYIEFIRNGNFKESAIRLKNISTGQFLSIDPTSNSGEVSLSPSGQSDHCIFFLDTPGGSEGGAASSEENLRIKDVRGRYLSIQKSKNSEDLTFKLLQNYDQGAEILELKVVSPAVVRPARQLQSIYSTLTEFLQYFQGWGLKQQSNSNQTLIYDFESATEAEGELEYIVNQVSVCLRSLIAFLSEGATEGQASDKKNQTNSVRAALLAESAPSFETRQTSILKQGVLDVLFRIAKLVHFKTYSSVLDALKPEHLTLIYENPGLDTNNTGSISIPTDLMEGLPQGIATPRVRGLITMVFECLRLIIWDSDECSYAAIKNTKFLKSALEQYKPEVEPLLMELAKALTSQDEETLRFVECWLKLVEEPNERTASVGKQTFLLNILTKLCYKSAQNERIELVQAKIFNSLFSLSAGINNTGKKPIVIKFVCKRDNDSPEDDGKYLATFPGIRTSQFQAQNPSLTNALKEHTPGSASVKLLALNKPDEENLPWLHYISAYIKLLSALCTERHDVAKVSMKEIGLDFNFVRQSLSETSSAFSDILKGALAEFLANGLLDRFPLKRSGLMIPTCIEYENLQFDFENPPLHWFIHKNIKDIDREVLEYSAETVLNLCREAFEDPQLVERSKDHPERLLNYQKSVLFAACEALDLGYMPPSATANIQALAGSIIHRKTDNSRAVAAINNIEMALGNSRLISTAKSLVQIAVRILEVITRLREAIQIRMLLKLYKFYDIATKEVQDSTDNVLRVLSLNTKDLSASKDSLALVSQIDLDRASDQKDTPTYSIPKINQTALKYQTPNQKLDEHLMGYVLEDCSEKISIDSSATPATLGRMVESLRINKQVKKGILNVLRCHFDQRTFILKRLLSTELVYGEEEKKIFQKLTGTLGSDGLSLENLTVLLDVFISANAKSKATMLSEANPNQSKYDAQDAKAKLINMLNVLSKELEDKKERKADFNKIQNLLRNLGWPLQLVRLLNLSREDTKEHKDLFEKLVNTLRLLCIYNQPTQRLLLPYISELLSLIEIGINSAGLLSSICEAANSNEILKLADRVFSRVNQLVSGDVLFSLLDLRTTRRRQGIVAISPEASQSLQQLIILKGLLSGMVFDGQNMRREEVQRRLLFRLLNCRQLARIFEYKYFSEIRSMILKENLNYKDYLVFYEFYASYITLLADLAWNSRIGIEQARRLVTKEQLIEILSLETTPVYFKKAFLKCLHQVFLPTKGHKVQWQNDFKLVEDVALIISKDLSSHTKYLDALLPKVEDMMEDRDTKLPPLEREKKSAIPQTGEEVFLASPTEYWDYLLSNENPPDRNYGLLYITYELLDKINQVENKKMSSEYSYLRQEIKHQLESLKAGLNKIAKQGENCDFPLLRLIISECLKIIPNESTTKIGQMIRATGQPHEPTEVRRIVDKQPNKASVNNMDNYEEELTDRDLKDYDKVVEFKNKCKSDLSQYIKRLLIDKRITFERLFDLLILTEASNFIKRAKEVMEMEEKELENLRILVGAMACEGKNIETQQNTDIWLSMHTTLVDLARLVHDIGLKDFKEHLTHRIDERFYPNKMTSHSNKSSEQLRDSYQRFLNFFVDSFLTDGKSDSELEQWIRTVVEKINQSIDSKSSMEQHVILLSKIQTTLIRSDSIMLLLRGLLILIKMLREGKDEAEINYVQDLFNAAETPLLCVSSVNTSSSPILVASVCKLLKKMLNPGNQRVQNSLYAAFNEGLFTRQFLLTLKERLESYLPLILIELKNPISSRSLMELNQDLLLQRIRGVTAYDMTIYILHTLKYFCDNCYLNFQNYLRCQIFDKGFPGPDDVNFLEETIGLLVTLLRERPDCLAQGESIGYNSSKSENLTLCNLVEIVLNVLTEFALGPCELNQRALIENRKVMDVVNQVLEVKLAGAEDPNLRGARARVLHQTAVFLESLVTGNKDKSQLTTLLEKLNIDQLRQQLLTIYMMKVRKNKNSLYREDFCQKFSEENQRDQPNVVVSTKNCTAYVCQEGKLSLMDLQLVSTAFNFFLLISQLEDKLHGHSLLGTFGEQAVKNRTLDSKYKSKFDIEELDEFTSAEQHIMKSKFNIAIEQRIRHAKTRSKSKIHPAVGERSEAYIEHQSVNTGDKPKDLISSEDNEKLIQYYEDQKNVKYNEARRFFMAFIASVEIISQDDLEKVHFQIPYCCRFISPRAKKNIMWNTTRNSDIERIESFFYQTYTVEEEMKRRQSFSSVSIFYFLIKNWMVIQKLNYLLILALNILMLIYARHEWIETSDQSINYTVNKKNTLVSGDVPSSFESSSVRTSFRIISYCQAFMTLLILILCAIDRVPSRQIALGQVKLSHEEREKIRNRKFEESSNKQEAVKTDRMSSTRQFVRDFLLLPLNLYHIVLLTLSLIALFRFNLLYAFLLFDIVKLSRTLTSMLRSLSRSFLLLFFAFVLGVILTYFYSVIGFNYFPEDYQHDESRIYKNYCHTLLDCFFSTLNNGLRAHGGIGEALGSEFKDGEGGRNYWGRVAFDLTFFIVILILLFSLCLGIIIDSFVCARSEDSKMIEEVENKCFVCGLSKFDLDTKGEGWYKHIYENHNAYNYLYFLVYLRAKDLGDCSGAEKHAKELCERDDVRFFPMGRALGYDKARHTNSH